jgi:hypothetical protein
LKERRFFGNLIKEVRGGSRKGVALVQKGFEEKFNYGELR